MAKYFLGVDGGQSSTTAVVGDDSGKVLGIGRGGPCNHVAAAEAREKFMGAIGGAVRSALSAAGLGAECDFEAACLGFSGGPADKDALISEMFRIGKRVVTHDALIALCGAHAGKPGIITIAGTGSICFGRNAASKTMRAGGWGYVYGDEGGGFDLTRQALRAALRMEEGWGPETRLRELLLESGGARDANDLLHRFYTPDFPRPRIAAMSQLVVKAAAAGDVVAASLLTASAQQLVGITRAVRGRLFEAGQPVRVSPIGGVFKAETLLRQFSEALELDEGNTVGPPLHGPAVGALLEAYRAAGLEDVELTGLPAEEK